MQYLRDNAPLTQRFEIDGRHISAIEPLLNKMEHAKSGYEEGVVIYGKRRV
jgi:hypothetical protein